MFNVNKKYRHLFQTKAVKKSMTCSNKSQWKISITNIYFGQKELKFLSMKFLISRGYFGQKDLIHNDLFK